MQLDDTVIQDAPAGAVVEAGYLQLDDTVIQDTYFGIEIVSGTVQIENSQIISNTVEGVYVEGGTVTAVCTQFRNNQTAAIAVDESTSPNVAISHSLFEHNGIGVSNLGDTAVTATNNWWGSATGPQDGVDVLGDVTVAPWLLWAPECISEVPDYEVYLPMVIRP